MARTSPPTSSPPTSSRTQCSDGGTALRPLDLFYHHLQEYRKRVLTNPSDIYNANDGIGSVLYSWFGSLCHGLPGHALDETLLWLNITLDNGPVRAHDQLWQHSATKQKRDTSTDYML